MISKVKNEALSGDEKLDRLNSVNRKISENIYERRKEEDLSDKVHSRKGSMPVKGVNVDYNEGKVKKPYDKKPTFFVEEEGNEKLGYNNNYSMNNATKSSPKKNVEIAKSTASSVKEYAYKEERNLLFRPTMEDMPKLLDQFCNDATKGLFCVFDGHGGMETVKYVHNRLPEVFAKLLIETSHNVDKSLNLAFQKVDEEIKNLSKKGIKEGTTACVVYFYRENDLVLGSKRLLTCANVGDTRAILITTNEVKRLSYDHKCEDEAEVERIRKVGGVVFNGRLFGQLAISRAIGDHQLKKYGISSSPYLNHHVITKRDKYVIICSDGVWDVVDEGEVFEMSLDCENADELSSMIVKKAREYGSQDNISCIVIKLN